MKFEDEREEEFWKAVVIAMIMTPSPPGGQGDATIDGIGDRLVMEFRKRRRRGAPYREAAGS